MFKAPKYSKIVILFNSVTNDELSTHVEEFLDCSLIITGDYLLVILDTKDEINTSEVSNGKIFSLSTIREYKTYKS